MGMQITANRLQLLNAGRQEPLLLKILDLKDAQGTSCGTKVILTIPVPVFENRMPDTVI